MLDDLTQAEQRPGRGAQKAVANALPRYRQILDVLRQRIADGGYALGGTMPTEFELGQEFQASRHTVREALRGLVDLGMVARRQGSGSVVTAAAPKIGYSQSFRSLAELFQFALTTHFVVRGMRIVVPSSSIMSVIGGQPRSRWLMVTGMRWEKPGGDAICYTHAYIPERLAWIKPELPGCVGPFYAHIEQRSGEPIIETIQEISAESMTPEIARALDRAPASIALRTMRRYVGAQGTLIASFNWHPADSFTYRMILQRSAAG